jgi:hypothetical protein
LPSDTTGAGAARGRPLKGFAFERLALERDAEMRDVALDHRKILILAAAMETQP